MNILSSLMVFNNNCFQTENKLNEPIIFLNFIFSEL